MYVYYLSNTILMLLTQIIDNNTSFKYYVLFPCILPKLVLIINYYINIYFFIVEERLFILYQHSLS